jgi:hypothetical protein
MQVPVFLTRQVFVKVVPAPIAVLSGMVTSATNAALFVQSGALVGMGVPDVGVESGCVVEAEVSVAMEFSGAGVSVAAGASVSVGLEAGDSVDVCPPQAASVIAINDITINSFLIILNSFIHEPDSWH